MRKHLSAYANSLLDRCAQCLGTSADALVTEFEAGLETEVDNYSRRLVEFCSFKGLGKLCQNIGERLTDSSFSRLTFDMMLAWESPATYDEERRPDTAMENLAKEMEDKIDTTLSKEGELSEDVPLFYSDIMPLLVSEEKGVGEDAFVWLGSFLPVVGDVVNARFTFEALTASTDNKLHYPAYDRFLKEIDKCIKYLLEQTTPVGIELDDDEFILHFEGTAKTHRVVRHIGTTSWPGRLTLTNKALYFEASGVISYENAIRLDLSKRDAVHLVKPASTGPWGAPVFDKAIIYESSDLIEEVVLEFPEMTSSTRRDHWLAITKEVILMHQFLSKYNLGSRQKEWEMQARSILGILRLHAAREMLRISQPVPKSFLIFTLLDEIPKGDYVLEELSNTLKLTNESHPCSASCILKSLDMRSPVVSRHGFKEGYETHTSMQPENIESLETTIRQVREEAEEQEIAKTTVDGIKEEGISYHLLVLVELLSPLKEVLPWGVALLRWENPMLSLLVLISSIIVIYKEWIGYSMSGLMLLGVALMLRQRGKRLRDEKAEIVVSTSSGQSTVESIVTAQNSLVNVRMLIQIATIGILKVQSIVLSRAPKHANVVMMGMVGAALFLALVPFRFVLIGLVMYAFTANLVWGMDKTPSKQIGRADRRLREFWETIPVAPVRLDSEVAT